MQHKNRASERRQFETQTKQTSEALRLTREQIEQADRAWLKVVPRITGPFTKTADGKKISINVTRDVTNLGGSPATHVHFHVTPYAFKHDAGQILAERDRIALELRSQSVPASVVIFPNDTHEYNATPVASAAPIPPPPNTPTGITDGFFVMLAGFVDYQFDGSTTHHQTGFMYSLFQVSRISEEDIRLGGFADSIRQVEASNLALRPNPLGGFYAT